MTTLSPDGSARATIGFNLPSAPRMEEEAGGQGGFETAIRKGQASLESLNEGLARLFAEREFLVKGIAAKDLDKDAALTLLDQNKSLLEALLGPPGQIAFRTEKVIYAILAFSAVVIVILSGLTAAERLPKEVTITFVGTVVGGVLATIAQKLGKVGR